MITATIQQIKDSESYQDLGRIPSDCFENKVCICPNCSNTKSVLCDPTVKLSSPPIYTLYCTTCSMKWEANLYS